MTLQPSRNPREERKRVVNRGDGVCKKTRTEKGNGTNDNDDGFLFMWAASPAGARIDVGVFLYLRYLGKTKGQPPPMALVLQCTIAIHIPPQPPFFPTPGSAAADPDRIENAFNENNQPL